MSGVRARLIHALGGASRVEHSVLQDRVRDLERATADQWAAIKQLGGFVLPPAHLQNRVAAYDDPFFLEHGEALLGALEDALGAVGQDLDSCSSVLDFGCGCARVLRALHYRAGPSQQLHGTDIDPEAIEWCRANYSTMAEFSVNPDAPPMGYTDGAFDLVYSVSVFTHLPEDMQFAWLRELERVTAPGGHLLLTTFNEASYQEGLTEEARAVARAEGFFFDAVGPTTEGLPGFYRQSYHTPEYIRARWSEYFEIVDIRERAIDDLQDIVVCRRR